MSADTPGVVTSDPAHTAAETSPGARPPLSPELATYRQHLVLAEQKAQEDYDKTVLALSGGALGVSFAFVDKFLARRPTLQPELLVTAWSCWAVSVAFVLISYYLSHKALRTAISQTDNNQIRSVRPGGIASVLLSGCNCASGVFFLAGVVLMVAFVRANLGV